MSATASLTRRVAKFFGFAPEVKATPRPEIHASFDGASSRNDNADYWASADALDADSAHSKGVRQRLVTRSRYEVGNNGYTDGIVQTHANHLVGVGPKLRMQTRSRGFNAIVEAAWKAWAKETQFRRKFWCMAHAHTQDGEAFGVIRNNPAMRELTQLDIVLFEAEQCTTPYLPVAKPGYIDGIEFDEFGNPVFYDVLKYHPGGQFFPVSYQQPEKIPAKFMLHWFQMRRPGQHRGIPALKSTLNLGAQSRQWRQATLTSADIAARLSVILKTQQNPNSEADPVAALSELPLTPGTMTAAPMGWDLSQMKSEHPNATYEAFNKAQISEQCRPLGMPYNIGACDSSSHNFSSGKLDAQGFYISLDVLREDANDLVLDKIFGLWFERATLAYGWTGDAKSPPAHTWDWPQHPQADVKSIAESNDIGLRNGTKTVRGVLADSSLDYDDVLPEMADDFGLTEDEMKATLLERLFPAPQPPPQQQASPQANADTQSTPAGGKKSAS